MARRRGHNSLVVRQVLSRMRLRRVRAREQRTGRRRPPRRFSEGVTLPAVAGAAALAVGLWLMLPMGGAPSWATLLAKAAALIIIGCGGQMLLRVVVPADEPVRGVWFLMLAMVLVALTAVRAAEWLLRAAPGPLPAGRVAPYAAPHAFAPLLVAMLHGGPVALVIGLIVGVALAVAAEADLGVFLLSFCATAVAAREAPRLRHRTRILRALGRVALWQTPVVLIMAILAPRPDALPAVAAKLAAIYAVLLLSGVAAVWLLPLFERLSGRTSLVTLNAYADLGQPLLQRLALEAPGTYHHSLMVANLAQAAADRIGANGLLARVGAYYHDIGKLGRPRFYMENQTQAPNPHDQLPPNISRMIIVNHVKEGVCLARLHRLPPPLTRMIAGHHGTGVIRWFHHKARAQAAAGQEPAEESHYRHGGPLPVSREESILALADAVEAASRSLAKVTPAHIENMVAAVIRAKWLDGQLDSSRLTNAELAEVRKAFVFTLTHLLHARQSYPAPLRDAAHPHLESSAGLPAGPAGPA